MMFVRMMRGLIAAFCLLGMVGAVAAADQTGGSGNAANRAKIYTQLGHSEYIYDFSYSPDGRTIVSGSGDKTIKLWDVASGRELRTLKGHTSSVSTAAFSPDGRIIVSCSYDDPIKLWNASTGRELRTLKGHTSYINTVAFSPDGRTIVSGSGDKTIKLWDVASGRELRTLKGHTSDVRTVAFSPDGRSIVSGSDDKTLKLWDAASGRELRTLKGHTSKVNTAAFSPDGRTIVSGSDDKTIKLWDASSGSEMHTLSDEYSHKVTSVAFSPDGQMLVSGGELDVGVCSRGCETIKLWNVASGVELRTLEPTGGINKVAFSPDGRTIVSSDGNSLLLFDAASGKKLSTMGGDSLEVNGITYSSSNNSIYSVGTDNLQLWNSVNGQRLRSMPNRVKLTLNGLAVAFSPDKNTFVTGSYDNSTELKDVSSGQVLRTLNGHSDRISTVAFSPDGRMIASGSEDQTIKLWDAVSGRELRTLRGNTKGILSVAFSPDGLMIVSSNRDETFNETIKLWDTASGQELRSLKFDGMGFAVAFSPDGRTIVSGGFDLKLNKQTLTTLDVASGRKLRTFGEGFYVTSVAFSPDGLKIVSVVDQDTIKIWDAASGKDLRTLSGPNGLITSIEYSPDGKYLIAGSTDGTIRKWDAATGKEIAQFASFKDGEWVTITPEGYYDASEQGDKHLNVRVGNGLHDVYGIDQYRESFYRPDLVKIALGGGSIKDFRNIATVKPSPQVQIVDTPQSTSDSEAKVTLKLTDMGGGIGDVRLYLNGSAVVLDNTRALKRVTTDDGKSITKTYTVKLINGKNSLRAIAFNADNSMQSIDALYEISASFKVVTKPTLHAIIVGIQDFKNPKLKLAYPVADAELFAATLMKSATGLFEKVDIKKLTTIDETTSENIKKELTALRSLNPDDLFVFYVASHGTVDDGEYFLITSNVGLTSTQHLRADALTQTDLKELIANIPTTKKVIVLDTCNAGAMGDAMQKAMLTRGMSEDTAIKILSRAVGSTILSASTSTQEALEGYQGHGLFTYVLAEGLSGKADKGKTGFVKTTDLVDYVDTEVPELAEKVFKRAQYPTNSTSGQGFHIGRVVTP